MSEVFSLCCLRCKKSYGIPITLESCGKKKHDFVWLEETIGDIEREEAENDE